MFTRPFSLQALWPIGFALLALSAPAAGQDDPLPSWNDGAAKAAIIDFVTRVTDETSRDFVPAPHRVAVFDYEGTLGVEQPAPAELAFEMSCVAIFELEHPEWRSTQPFKAALETDLGFLAEGGEQSFAEIAKATHAGWSMDDYEMTLSSWVSATNHERFSKPYTKLVYQPMLELLAYLRDNGFQNYIVSGHSRDFMRPWVERVFGVGPESVVGSSMETTYEVEDGQATLTRLPTFNFIGGSGSRPAGFYEQVGRRPIAAFGNADTDIEMLQWTTMGLGPRLGMLVHHTDAEREFAYDRTAGFGRLDKALDAADASRWIIIDMKADWDVIFPFENHRL
jgi:hypothetical protein